ncbi:putative RNA polymerase II subunit B1 CTD phosphatase RPAP2 isoform X5 [Ictidomys tridecemlineatus]
MADWGRPRSAGQKARGPRASRKAAGTKETSVLKQEDAFKRKTELEAAVKKKIEFERRALHIVEQLLEENITDEFLMECGKFITPAHYSDVVDERSIIKLCGYPLCQKKLGIVPKQKYKISTKTNKVYDITERKSFCSDFCYKASKFFEAQIPKTPVWVREEERHPDFQLLKEGQRGSNAAVKPLPSYENLKKETETLNLRIREFYRGRYVLNEETTKSQDLEEHDPTFPLIDSSSQNQIRKRIVLEKLSKVLPGLLGPLQITLGDIYTQLKNLIRTFRLTNRNIIHKPVEWTLIAVVLLSSLTPILGIQKHSPKNVVFTQFIATLLEELQLKNEDLESLTIIFRTSC